MAAGAAISARMSAARPYFTRRTRCSTAVLAFAAALARRAQGEQALVVFGDLRQNGVFESACA